MFKSTRLEDVWKRVKVNMGHKQPRSQLCLGYMRKGTKEPPRSFYDCLYTELKESNDEKITPLNEALLIVLWLKAMHPDLPQKVEIQFSHLLSQHTLSSLQTKIISGLQHILKNSDKDTILSKRPATKSPPHKA